jgi:hypothetical protein
VEDLKHILGVISNAQDIIIKASGKEVARDVININLYGLI